MIMFYTLNNFVFQFIYPFGEGVLSDDSVPVSGGTVLVEDILSRVAG